MKYIKNSLLLFLFAFFFALVSCKKDSTTGPVSGGAISGIWSLEESSYEWLLTTNSDQTAITPFYSEGQLDVTGAVNTKLDILLINWSEVGDILIIKVDDELNWVYTLYKPAAGNEARLIIQSTQQRFSGTINYTYANNTLTVTQSTFTDAAANETVTVSGTISVRAIDIPANVPTAISFPEIFIDSGDIINVTTYEFKNDGTFSIITLSTNSSFTSGTYTTSGNQLTLMVQSGSTATYDYSVSGSLLTLTRSDILDFCAVLGNYNTQAECFPRVEEVFNLTAGSLAAMTTKSEITLTKAAVKHGTIVGRKFDLINPTKVITNDKLKIKKLKELL